LGSGEDTTDEVTNVCSLLSAATDVGENETAARRTIQFVPFRAKNKACWAQGYTLRSIEMNGRIRLRQSFRSVDGEDWGGSHAAAEALLDIRKTAGMANHLGLYSKESSLCGEAAQIFA